ncbi:MAG: hypothetical protein AAGG81_07090 [Chlamydiota bacterium]
MTIPTQVYPSDRTPINGYLKNFDGHFVKKGKFHVYDSTNNFLAYGKTSPEGKFEIGLPISKQSLDEISLTFRLCREEKLSSEHPEIKRDNELAKRLAFIKQRTEVQEGKRKVTVEKGKSDLGTVEMDVIFEEEKVPLSYLFHIATAAIPASLISGKETLQEKLDFFDWNDASDVQDAYCVDQVELTQENTWNMLTNGICPIYFKQLGEFIISEVNWDDYQFDKLQSLPNVRIFWKEGENEKHEISKIEVQFRETLHPSSDNHDKGLLKVYLPKDDDFKKGLRIANSVFHVYGQTTYHLAIGHVYGARVSQLVHDYLNGSKLGEFLLPHCQFIRKISNELGKTAIFGEDGVLNASALSVAGIGNLINDTLAALDPFSFKPREPMEKNHLFAHVQKFHFDIVEKSVKEFFEQNWNEIVKDWNQVHKFFLKLHKSSPTYRPWAGEDLDEAGWSNSLEIGGTPNPIAPDRSKYRSSDIGVKSMRHIARNPMKPEKHDRELVEQFFTDFIFHVTVMHSWLHRTQYGKSDFFPHMRDLNFSPITINNYGEGLYGGISEAEANLQLKTLEIFRRFAVEKYALVKNEKVDEGLVKRILNASGVYLFYGLDPVKELQVSTVI